MYSSVKVLKNKNDETCKVNQIFWWSMSSCLDSGFQRGGNSEAGGRLARNIGIDLLKLASSLRKDFYKNIWKIKV